MVWAEKIACETKNFIIMALVHLYVVVPFRNYSNHYYYTSRCTKKDPSNI